MKEKGEAQPLLPDAGDSAEPGVINPWRFLGLDVYTYNVLVMAIGFMVLFCSYNSYQNMATSLLSDHHNLGQVSLGTLYSSVVATVMFSPALVGKLNEKWVIVAGSVCFVVYMASMVKIVYGVVVAFSFVAGVGASILWVGQGVLLTKCSRDGERGRMSGLFWTIFQLCNVFGNLGAYFVFKDTNKQDLFLFFVGVGALGVLILLALKPLPAAAATAIAAGNGDSRRPLSAVKEGFALLRQPAALLLVPMFLWTGFELAFWAGEFTNLFDSKAIGLVLAFGGAAEVFGGIVTGKAGDVFGRSSVIVFAGLVYALGLVGAGYLASDHPPALPSLGGASLLAYLCAVAFGLGDAAFNTQVYAIIAEVLPGDVVGGFAVFQLFQNVGSAVGFFYSIALPVHGPGGTSAQLYVQAAVLLVSAVLFCVADRCFNTAARRSGGRSVVAVNSAEL